MPDVLDILVWLRARIGVTTSGGDVTAWADQSGNGHDSTEVDGGLSGGTAPVVLTNQLDGHPAVFFEEPHGIRCDTGPTYNQETDPQCFIVIAKSTSGGGLNDFIDYCQPGSSIPSTGPPLIRRGGSDWIIRAGADTFTASGADDDWHMLIGNFDDNAQALYVDGVEVLTGASDLASISRTGWKISTINADFVDDDLTIAEYVFLDGNLDAAGRAEWRDYFRQSSEYPSLP